MEIKVSKLNAVQAGFIKQTHFLYLNIEFTSEEMARDLLYKLWEFYGDDWMKESLSRERWIVKSIEGGVVKNFAHELPKEPQTEALNKHNVMGSLPTDNEISAMALLTVNLEDSDTAKIIHKAAFEAGARWAISELSGQ